jgi:hypothetical protein
LAVFYVFDSSPMIDMKWNFPPEWNAQLLSRFAKMARERRWISVGQVLAELIEKDDDLAKWAREHRDYFPEADEPTQDIVRDILLRFPRLIIPEKEIPDADPFVIAEALPRSRVAADDLFAAETKMVVVSQERTKRDRPTIPSVCEYYGLTYCNLFAFLRSEGIQLTA